MVNCLLENQIKAKLLLDREAGLSTAAICWCPKASAIIDKKPCSRASSREIFQEDVTVKETAFVIRCSIAVGYQDFTPPHLPCSLHLPSALVAVHMTVFNVQ